MPDRLSFVRRDEKWRKSNAGSSVIRPKRQKRLHPTTNKAIPLTMGVDSIDVKGFCVSPSPLDRSSLSTPPRTLHYTNNMPLSLVGSIFGKSATEDAAEPSSSSKKEKNVLSKLFDKRIEVAPKSIPEESRSSKKTENKQRKRKHSNNVQNEEDDLDGQPDSIDTRQDPIDTTEAGTDANNDDDNAEDRTIFVGNLPAASTTRKSLAQLFADCGKIVSTRIRSVPIKGVKIPPERAGDQDLVRKVCSNKASLIDTSHKASVQGYVVFADVTSVEKALQKNNTTVWDDATNTQRHLRVDHATPTLDARQSVFVGNLPFGADEDSLQDHFAKGCDIPIKDINVRIVREKESFQCRGFGYVKFSEQSMVATALQKMHGSVYQKRELRVLVCGKRFKNKQGKGSLTPNKKQKRQIGGSAKVPKGPRGQTKELSGNKESPIGALRRVLTKQVTEQSSGKKKIKRRGEKKSSFGSPRKAGVSKRAAAEAKTGKRVKKIQKRIAKGMGKSRRS